MRTTNGRRMSWSVVAVLVIGILALLPLAPVAGQQGDATQEADSEVTPTPIVGSASGQPSAPPAEETEVADPQGETQPAQQAQPSGPVPAASGGDTADPVLAQGLIYLNSAEVVWQVREVEITEGATVTGNARIILQREGASVIRNDLTGKRARLEPGEAYFAAAGDPYSTYPDGSQPSQVWVFEVSNSNQVGDGAFYLSPNVTGYPEGVYDFEFTRHIARAGEPTTVTGGDGPSMLMVLAGQVQITDESGTAELTTRDGLIINGDAEITASGSEAVVVSMTIGPRVSDESAAPPAAEPGGTTEGDEDDSGESASSGEAGGTVSQGPAEPDAETGEYVTSIRVGALDSIGVTFYADGELVYEGWLEAGEWTAFYTGSVFEVYTTSGTNTWFENTCGGEPFWMDREPGDRYYVLEAGPSSCAPVD